MPDRRRRRPMADWVLALEAALWLALARGARRALSFSRLARWAEGVRWAREASPDPQAAERIGWAVGAASRRAPWSPLCFERGLAAQTMLRLRRQPSTLYYGARNDGANGPSAHVWVRLSGLDVVGGEAAAGFVVLAAFPSQRPAGS